MGEVTWIHNHVIFQFLYLMRVNGKSKQAHSSLRHSCLDLPILQTSQNSLLTLLLLWLHPCWPRGSLYPHLAWVVPSVASCFVSNLELHICHLPLTCHYKTGNGFQFLAKLSDNSACLPRKYSNSILFMFFCLLPSVCTLSMLSWSKLYKDWGIYFPLYLHVVSSPTPILVMFLNASLIFFIYVQLFLSYQWTTFYIIYLFPLVNSIILHWF